MSKEVAMSKINKQFKDNLEHLVQNNIHLSAPDLKKGYEMILPGSLDRHAKDYSDYDLLLVRKSKTSQSTQFIIDAGMKYSVGCVKVDAFDKGAAEAWEDAQYHGNFYLDLTLKPEKDKVIVIPNVVAEKPWYKKIFDF